MLPHAGSRVSVGVSAGHGRYTPLAHHLRGSRLLVGVDARRTRLLHQLGWLPTSQTRSMDHDFLMYLSVMKKITPRIPPKCGAPHFGGALRVVSFITEPRVIRKILQHLGNKANRDRAPPRHVT